MSGKNSQPDKAARDNRSKQLNPTSDAFWKSRDLPRPETPSSVKPPERKPE